MADTLFVSDLHLSPERPETIRLFLRFLQGPAEDATALYILGDLFDAWIGDDLQQPPIPLIQSSMQQLSAHGTRLLLMHGNRDFLIGERFAEASGCQLLQDPCLIELAGEPTLLMHGDLLCSDDQAYQEARQLLRSPDFIRDFLARPIPQRLALAREYRQRSGEATSLAPAEIMDVNQQTLEQMLRTHGARRLIHGHTHRPGHHRFQLDGKPAERWVLPEWHEDGGGYLRCNGEQLSAERFPD